MCELNFRRCDAVDVPVLAQLNQQLQIDEGHRLRMQLPELERRMADWLTAGGYESVIFERGGATAGYALYRREAEHVYLKQFFVCRELRRQGVGRQAMQWLSEHVWKESPAVFLDALIHNESGIAFWRAVGFRNYCITMEKRLPPAVQ